MNYYRIIFLLDMSKSDTALTKSDADGDVLNEKLLQQNSSIQEP